MKRVLFAAAVFSAAFFAASISGCASIEESQRYDAEARGRVFGEFFPSYYSLKEFSTTDEAYEWVNIARAKFRQTVGKEARQGLGARLAGPRVEREKPVTVVCYIDNIRYNNEWMDFAANDKPNENILRTATTISLTFLFFYQNRAGALTSFYLDARYNYKDNSQIEKFYFGRNEYTVQYPVGWDLQKVFQYLNEEID